MSGILWHAVIASHSIKFLLDSKSPKRELRFQIRFEFRIMNRLGGACSGATRPTKRQNKNVRGTEARALLLTHPVRSVGATSLRRPKFERRLVLRQPPVPAGCADQHVEGRRQEQAERRDTDHAVDPALCRVSPHRHLSNKVRVFVDWAVGLFTSPQFAGE